MNVARTVAEVRSEVARLRARGRPVVLVPTMGALHDGHRSLVAAAREQGSAVLSVFVNPLQFGAGEDYETYPWDPARDAELARDWGVELLFAPAAAEFVRAGSAVRVEPGPTGDELEGRFRPGHFRGVLTIVAKLFHVVQPDVAVFGQKDLQQSVLVRAMVRDLDFPLRVDVRPTVRDADGLALSSRNVRLSGGERAVAPVLFQALQAGAEALAGGDRTAEGVRARVLAALARFPQAEVDYVAVLRADDLARVDELTGSIALVAAVRLGRTRLIDNLIVDAGDGR